MADLHRLAFWLTAALVVLLVIAAIRFWQVGPPGRRLVDRLILAIIGSTLAAGGTGLGLLLGGDELADPLHAVYGIVGLAGVPTGRYLFRSAQPHRQALGLAIAGLLVGGILARLAMTGG
jgi:hypothetical protein